MKKISFFVLAVSLFAFIFIGCENRYLTGAKVDIKNGNLEKAKENLLLAKKETPDDPNVYLFLADIYGKLGDYEKASEEINTGLIKAKDNKKLTQDFLDMRFSYWAKNFNKSVMAYNGAINPQNSEKLRADSLEIAEKSIKLAVKFAPDSLKNYRMMASIYNLKKDNLALIETYKKALEISPNEPTFTFNIGVAYTYLREEAESNNKMDEAKKYDEEAMAWFKKAYEINPKDEKIIELLGNSYMNKENYEEAIKYYQAGINVNPANKILAYNLGLAYYNMSSKDKARETEYLKKSIEALKNAKKILNKSDDLWEQATLNLGKIALHGKDTDTAIACFDELIKEKGESKDLLNLIAAAYTTKGDSKKALEYLKKAEKLPN